MLNALIPKSYYLIQSGFNVFTLTEKGVDTQITVPIGCYLLNTFSSVVANLLTSNSPNGWTYTISFPNINTSANTGKYTFTVSGNAGNQPSIKMPLNGNIYKPFGFNLGSTNAFVANTLVSTNVVKLQVEDRLFINSNIHQSGSLVDGSVIQDINGSASPDFSVITWQCPDILPYAKPLRSKDDNTYSFSLTNEDGQLLDLNGQNINFTLLFFRRDDISDRMKAFLQIMTKQLTSAP